MRYLIMVQSNPTSLAHWQSLTEEDREAFGRARFALTDALMNSGHLITSEGLAPVETAKQITVRTGQVHATDGPMAEVKEHLAGFYLVNVRTWTRRSASRRAFPTPRSTTCRSARSSIEAFSRSDVSTRRGPRRVVAAAGRATCAGDIGSQVRSFRSL